MSAAEQGYSPVERTGVERSLEVSLGSVGGFELRPTRLFVWKGGREAQAERIVSFGREPVGLDYTRRESTHQAGPLQVRTVGNPLMTIALAGAIAFRRWADPPDARS
jgi:hypothetical protein